MAYPVSKVVLPTDLVGASNGHLTSQLVSYPFDGKRTAQTHSLTARAFKAMYAACWEDTGTVLTIVSTGDAYRSFDQQLAVFKQRYTTTPVAGSKSIRNWNGQTWYLKLGFAQVSTPGNSNHGLGLALDVAAWTGSHVAGISSSPAWHWLLANAAAFGFSWEVQTEPWHLHYFTGDNVPPRVLAFEAGLPGPGPAPTPTPEPQPQPPAGDPVNGYPEQANKPVLSRGAKSALVLYAQVVIFYKAGGSISMDGQFGEQTEARVKDFQRFFGLEDDGKIGKNTWGLIDMLARS